MPEHFKPPWLSEPSSAERLRHCWVTADEHGQVPALLLEWRQTPGGYEARVVRPVLDVEDGKWRPREERLPLSNWSRARGRRSLSAWFQA